jgi:predicted O-methyltransferase YrrM
MWQTAVQGWLDSRKLKGQVILRDDDDMDTAAHLFEDGSFDIVFIDCLDYQRMACIEASLRLVKPGGWLILDDAHWFALQDLPRALDGWQHEDIRGMHWRKTLKMAYAQTSIYRRPL